MMIIFEQKSLKQKKMNQTEQIDQTLKKRYVKIISQQKTPKKVEFCSLHIG